MQAGRLATLCVLLFACAADPDAVPPTDACEGASILSPVNVLAATSTSGLRSIAAADDVLFVHRSGEWIRIAIGSGEQRVFSRTGAEELIVGAAQNEVLIARRSGGGRATFLRSGVERNDVTLGEGGFGQPIFADVASPAVRSIDSETAAWLDSSADRVWFARGARAVDASGDLTRNRWPDVENGRVVWASGPDDASRIVLSDGSERIAFSGPRAQSFHPVLRGPDVVFVSGVGMFVRRADGSIELLHEGACGPPTSGGAVVAFACDPFVDHPGFPGFGRELFVFDGQSLRPVETDGGMITSVRSDGGRVAWIEYPVDQSGCGSRDPNARGRLFLADRARQWSRVEVAEVQIPCWCCERPVIGEVVLSDGVVAWNYATPAEGVSIGYAALSRDGCGR